MSNLEETTAPEVESTIKRLISHKNVKGVLILSKPTGIILRSAGTLFQSILVTPPSLPSSTSTISLEDTNLPDSVGLESKSGGVVANEIALKYAKMAQRLVESIGEEVGQVENNDELQFLRIRTKKHELLITPDSLYILVVIQDPSI